MSDFVTIATFYYPPETAVIKGKLESEGIECILRDELTVQVHHFLSNAIGGIKLQVRRKDVAKARQILKEAGYLKEETAQPGKIWLKLSAISSKIPIINKLAVEIRLLILAGIILSTLIFGVLAWFTPTTSQILTENAWCLRSVTHHGKNFVPNTSGLNIYLEGSCSERIGFRPGGELVLPGFNSSAVYGNWKLQNGRRLLIETDTLQHLFNGVYEIRKFNNSLTLTSENTVLYCYKSE